MVDAAVNIPRWRVGVEFRQGVGGEIQEILIVVASAGCVSARWSPFDEE